MKEGKNTQPNYEVACHLNRNDTSKLNIFKPLQKLFRIEYKKIPVPKGDARAFKRDEGKCIPFRCKPSSTILCCKLLQYVKFPQFILNFICLTLIDNIFRICILTINNLNTAYHTVVCVVSIVVYEVN